MADNKQCSGRRAEDGVRALQEQGCKATAATHDIYMYTRPVYCIILFLLTCAAFPRIVRSARLVFILISWVLPFYCRVVRGRPGQLMALLFSPIAPKPGQSEVRRKAAKVLSPHLFHAHDSP